LDNWAKQVIGIPLIHNTMTRVYHIEEFRPVGRYG
jgi:hypothetical protein